MKLITTMALCFAAMFGGEHGGGESGNGGDDKNKKTATLDIRVRVGATARGTDVTVAELCEITPITGQPGLTGLGQLKQGFVERSNVQIVNELVNLIVAQRAYEVNSRAIQASDQMLSTATNIVR